MVVTGITGSWFVSHSSSFSFFYTFFFLFTLHIIEPWSPLQAILSCWRWPFFKRNSSKWLHSHSLEPLPSRCMSSTTKWFKHWTLIKRFQVQTLVWAVISYLSPHPPPNSCPCHLHPFFSHRVVVSVSSPPGGTEDQGHKCYWIAQVKDLTMAKKCPGKIVQIPTSISKSDRLVTQQMLLLGKRNSKFSWGKSVHLRK